MPDAAVYDAVAASLREGFRRYESRKDPSEAEARQLLINPVLSAIGYTDYYRRPEMGAGRNRPDEVCYTTEEIDDGSPAALIVEAKPPGGDFDKARGGLTTDSPNRQIQRYLRQHPASGPNTIGVLTDGVRWRIYERAGSASSDVRFLREYDFGTLASEADAPQMLPTPPDDLREFVDRLCRECILEQIGKPHRPPKLRLADQLLSLFEIGIPEPHDVLPHLLGGRMTETHDDLADHLSLDGVRQDASEQDWDAYSYALGAPLQPAQADRLIPEPLQTATAVVRFAPETESLSRADTALCARTFARVSSARVSVLFAYTATNDGATEARLAVCANGRVNMTAPFDPSLPTPSARAAAESVLGLLAQPEALAPERLLAPLEVAPLRQQFYADVSAWTKRLAAGKDAVQREAVLRHLIRVMFAWILKETELIPTELFEQGFVSATTRNVDSYHNEFLRFLFHERLNLEEDKRRVHSDPIVNEVMDAAPFLNGSLFQEQEGDDALDIPASAYWNVDPQTPGLFTLFSRYHWTTDEHRPGESDQTLDPELLSNLFERLILPIESGETLDRQPRGTYYTPADVTAEMVKDALAAATRSHASDSVTDEALRDLFGDQSAPLPAMTPAEQRRLTERIHALRIFDPAVGSGAFLFACLTALQTALQKLEPDSPEPTPGIIKNQLYGQDIHPLAAQITRLRLFIALKAADRDAGRKAPLPNLEARIVCADTLETRADPAWRPDHPEGFATADPEIRGALTAVAENRSAWLDAHSESDKQTVLQRDELLRGNLHLLLDKMGALASPELRAFAATPILPLPSHPAEAKVARTDARLLFYENPWRGFDIVIGNPPYEALKESMDTGRVKLLKSEKDYRTTNCGDLYPPFCEVALALAKPDGGVVTMIVPLSIAFGQRQRTMRDVFEGRCASISLRHYDNRPDTIFSMSPTVKSPENRQRATIVTAIRGNDAAVTRTTGIQRWHANERHLCLPQRQTAPVPQRRMNVDERIAKQWPRTPTPAVAEMVANVFKQEKTVTDYLAGVGLRIAIPKTAYRFLSILPEGAVSPRSETMFTVADDATCNLILAALNGSAAHGWWAIFGDSFHVNLHEMTSFAVPDKWVATPQPAIELGERLKAAIPRCIVENEQQGGIWRNVDFHTYAPDLIAEIDRLYIEALGLPVEPLLSHLRIMRSNRSWDFPS